MSPASVFFNGIVFWDVWVWSLRQNLGERNLFGYEQNNLSQNCQTLHDSASYFHPQCISYIFNFKIIAFLNFSCLWESSYTAISQRLPGSFKIWKLGVFFNEMFPYNMNTPFERLLNAASWIKGMDIVHGWVDLPCIFNILCIHQNFDHHLIFVLLTAFLHFHSFLYIEYCLSVCLSISS